MRRLTCSSCSKQFSVDETKVPMREVTFPCPSCKSKITVDGRSLHATAEPHETPVPREASSPQGPVADENGRTFGRRALIFGVDDPAVREAARAIGLSSAHVADAGEARELFLQEYPPVVFIRIGQAGPPPLSEITPMVSFNPSDRRRSFFILVADNLRTLDGNAAFLYGVNLIVAAHDLESFSHIYAGAVQDHRRLYQFMDSARSAE